MPTIQQAVLDFLETENMTPKELAERSGINQLTVNSLVKDGSLPRKAEHREYLRVVLDIGKDEWAEILLESSGLPNLPDDVAPLQALIAKHMFLQGLTERGLSKLSGIPYGTVLGVVRKGAIPRGNSLHRIGDSLGLEPSLLSAALQRSGGNPEALPNQPDEDPLDEGLAPLVARRIRKLGLTIGSYAERLGIGYLQLSSFLDSGTPPTDDRVLAALREDLNIDEQSFTAAITSAHSAPKPGTVSARKGEPPPDSSQLQQALIHYMNRNKLTIKALSDILQLSQITVSRLVKQGVRPSRSRTHSQLRTLLDLTENEYGDLLANKLDVKSTAFSSQSAPGNVESDALTPITDKKARNKDAPDHDTTTALIAKSSAESGDDLEFEATSLAMSYEEIMDQVENMSEVQRQALVSYLHRLKKI